MIAQFLKTQMAQHGMSSADLARIADLPVDDIDNVLNSRYFISFNKLEMLLNYFGAETGVCSGGEIWAEGKRQEPSIQDNLIAIFSQQDMQFRRPGQMGTSPIGFLLQYLDPSNLEQTKDLLSKAVEYFDPRLTVLDVAIADASAYWQIYISYFEHQAKSRGNFVFPYSKLQPGAELPEVTRRKAFEEFVHQDKISAALETIESARWQLQQSTNQVDDLTLILLKRVDASILDEASKELLLKTQREVEKSLDGGKS